MKKIAAIAAMMMIPLSYAPTAQAAVGDLVASSGGSCTTSGGADPADLINIRVSDGGGGVLVAKMNFRDDNLRKWHWKLFHNGGVSYSGTFDLAGGGDYEGIAREVANFQGTDRLRYEVINSAGTVVCETRVGVDYGG